MRLAAGLALRQHWVQGPVRRISEAALWARKYPLPTEAHPVEDMLEDVKRGLQLVREGSPGALKEGSNVLERAHAIASAAFGESGDAATHVRHALCVACFNAGRFAAAEKHARGLLKALDPTSAVDRFEVRVILADSLRRQGRTAEAEVACVSEPADSVEQRLELLARRAWLLRQGKGTPPHEVLNEAAELSNTLAARSAGQARHSAAILAMQGLLSLEAGLWEEALERAAKGQAVVEQYRAAGGDTRALAAELGDVLTVQGRALLAGKQFLRAEETLDEALAQYGDDHARAAEALLALGQLFEQTQSNTYAEGTYRKLLAVISRSPGEVASENVREAYDKYAWFLRHAKRIPEAEEIEQEYIRFYHKI
jgi:tetratricopeptide (TPR) repeat protein